MSTFEVAIWETRDLYDLVGYGAQTRAKEYLEGAINTHSEHGVNVSTPTGVIGAPQEIEAQSFDATYPCDRSFTATYDNLTQWWVDYVKCNLTEVRDVDILLTAYDSEGGRCLEDHYAVAEGGPNIADLPSSYDLYGCTTPYDSMQTALHEIAHGLMDGTADGFLEHDVGDIYDHSGLQARTPMATTNQYNECDVYVGSHDGCDEMRYSECCESKMKHTS